jgi:phosphohistidine phosphatase
MEILLIRHGHAVDEAPGLGDGGRWLSEKGRKVTRKVARWLAKSRKRRPVAIWTSPLVRAVQTAEILAAEAGLEGEVPSCAQLGPGHDPGDLLKLLASAGATVDGPLALVGHEPALSLLATALLGDIGFAGLKKSGVLGLTWTPPAPPAQADGNGNGAPALRAAGELWFVLDPARMKSQKHIVPRPASEPPAAEQPPAEG